MEASQYMRAAAKTVVLEIIEARDLPLSPWTNQPPNAFVKITGAGVRSRTRVIEGTCSPKWKETITFPKPEDTSALNFSVHHRTNAVWDNCISALEITFGVLQHGQEYELKLRSIRGKKSGGVLVVRAREADVAESATAALHDSRIAGQYLQGTLENTETVSSLVDLIPSLGPFLDIASQIATLHPYVNIAWQITSLAIQVPRAQLQRDEDVVKLITQMEELYSFVTAVDKLKQVPILEDTLQAILNQSVECAFFIRGYISHNFGERALLQSVSDTSKQINEFRDQFRRLRERFDTASSIQISFVSSRSLTIVENIQRDMNLAKLRPVAMPVAGRPSCLPNTRLDVIKVVTEWITDEHHKKPVFWISGMTGTGKSTISTSIADISRELRRLGAFIFFERDVGKRSKPTPTIRTLAYKLAQFDSTIAEAILAAIESSPDIAETSLAFQFRKLIEEPLASVAPLHFGGPIVVVIDALDECGDATSRKELLSVLSQGFAKLPSFMRLLVTSRRERDIERAFHSNACVFSYELDLTSNSAAKDIEIFIHSELQDIRANNDDLDLPADWPGGDKIQLLAKRAAGLFVWASTVCRFIEDGHDPRKQLDVILNTSSNASNPLAGLDRLYKTALRSAGHWDDAIFRADCQAIIGLILVAKVPLRCKAIDDLLCLPRPSLHTIKGLGSVIDWSETNPIRTLHPSFHDFLTHEDRCGTDYWFVDVTTHHRTISLACITMLERTLKENICDLTLGEPFDDRALPESVMYSCMYWIEHVCMGLEVDAERIYTFMASHLLHWMEAMSILRKPRRVIRQLRNLAEYVKSELNSKLFCLIHEAQRFAQFFADVCGEHPLLIYVTALSFTPIQSCIFELFGKDGALDVSGGMSTQGWPPRVLQIQGHSHVVQAVAFSPDGLKIASASMDKTIRVWDSETGTELLPPLEGHSGILRSIAFSPDGFKIVSGSWDKTARVWDTTTGREIFLPLEGHEEAVLSVVFSPDGRWIVSGSDDRSMRIWDADTGKQIILLAGAHEEGIRSIAFAPGGSRFASASYDKTIRIWDTDTAMSHLPPFRGHEHWILCVNFSPDGSKIVSGAWDATIKVWDVSTGNIILSVLESNLLGFEVVVFSPDGSTIMSCTGDSTIRFWDARTGQETRAPLLGHDNGVRHVAFSPDGRKVVSASGDKTVGVWDISTKASGKYRARGHKMRVFSVAFSPDGLRMASGSADKTIRLWEVSSGDEISSPLEGHERAVFSVSFSHDGLRLVSGSADNTIRIWVVETGQLALPPLRGHDSWVFSVAWSPDDSRLISGSGDKTIRIWNALQGTEVLPPLLGHQKAVLSVTYSSDGSKILSGSWDRTVRVWDISTAASTLATPRLLPKATVSGATSPDIPKQILGEFGKTITEEETDVAIEALLPHPEYQHCVFSVAWSPDGRKIAAGSYDKVVRGWDTSSGARAFSPLHNTHWPLSVAFAPDGLTFASASWDKTIRVWNLVNGTLTLPVLRGHEDAVFSVTFSLDGLKIASGSGDRTIRIWNPTTGLEIIPPLRGHEHGVHAVAFSPDSSRIASGSWDKTIRVWDSSTGTELLPALQGHDEPVLSVVFTVDGSKIVSGSADKTIRVWSIGAEIVCTHTLHGHNDWVFSVAVSPDCSTIASGSGDGTIRSWDISTGSEILPPLEGHDMTVMSVAFSPDGTKIVSGSWDKTVRVWDTKSRVESMPLVQGYEDAVLLIESSADESQIIAWSFDGKHRIWDIQPCNTDGPSSLPIMLLQKHGIAFPISFTSHRTRQPKAGEFYADESKRWIVHTTTGRRAKLPAGIKLSNFRAHGSTLVAWGDGYQPVFIRFREDES